jgi:hypothetical protein
MSEEGPVLEISARFASAERARAVVEAMNRWFRWIVDGSEGTIPDWFGALGADSRNYAWSLEDDVDWTLGPHARAVTDEVRIAIHTRDTHLSVAGLLRQLGGRSVKIVRDVATEGRDEGDDE